MNNIMVSFTFLDDHDQKFHSAHFPAMPRIGDLVLTPPPRERRYRVVAVGFDCAGSRADETTALVELRQEPAAS